MEDPMEMESIGMTKETYSLDNSLTPIYIMVNFMKFNQIKLTKSPKSKILIMEKSIRRESNLHEKS